MKFLAIPARIVAVVAAIGAIAPYAGIDIPGMSQVAPRLWLIIAVVAGVVLLLTRTPSD